MSLEANESEVPQSLGESLLQSITRHADAARNVCLIDANTDCSLSYQEVLAQSVGAARGWGSHGLVIGDVVALFSMDDLTAAFLGALYEGLTLACFETSWLKEELVRALEQVRPRVLVADADRVGLALAAIAAAGSSCLVLNSGPGFLSGQQDSYRTYRPVSVPDLHKLTAIVEFTSGSTGLPKPVELSHYTCFTSFLKPSSWQHCICLLPGTRMMVQKCMSWLVDVMLRLMCLAAGETVILTHTPSSEEMLHLIQKYKV